MCPSLETLQLCSPACPLPHGASSTGEHRVKPWQEIQKGTRSTSTLCLSSAPTTFQIHPTLYPRPGVCATILQTVTSLAILHVLPSHQALFPNQLLGHHHVRGPLQDSNLQSPIPMGPPYSPLPSPACLPPCSRISIAFPLASHQRSCSSAVPFPLPADLLLHQ